MERASLALRIPPQLLPSSTRGAVDSLSATSQDSSSVDSEPHLPPALPGYARSASTPAKAAAPRQLHQSTGLSPTGKPNATGLTTLTVPADSATKWGSQSTDSVAAMPTAGQTPQQQQAPPTEPVVERRGSRTGLHPGSSESLGVSPNSVAAPAAAPGGITSMQPSAAGSHRSASPDRYSSNDFEEETSSQRPASPGSACGAAATASTGAMPAQWGARKVSSSGGEGARSGLLPRSPSTGRRSPTPQQPSRSSSRLGYLSTTAVMEAKRSAVAAGSRPSSRPCSASPHKQQQAPWPCSPSPVLGQTRDLEARVSKQMGRDPADWTVREVCDWLELIGLGQWRRTFVHNAVSGALLLRLSNEELKKELGMGPLGHREGLLTALNDLEQYWRQQQSQQQAQQQAGAGGGDGSSDRASVAGSRPGSPPPRLADVSLQRAYAQRARLLRELDKAASREAQRRVAAEQALRVVGQASDEVRKLQASICELDREIGWEAAAEEQQYHPLDVHGVVAWQPAGKQRAVLHPGSPGSPAGHSGSPGSGGASPMSQVSRQIMERHTSGGAGSSFLDRLASDIAVRHSKAAEAKRQAGRYMGGADEQLAEKEREQRDVRFIREMVAAKSDELAEALGSGDGGRVAEACDGAANSFQQEWGLSEEVVAAVRKLRSPGRKAAKLAGVLRSAQFMQRLQHDLSTREGRLLELQDRFYKLEASNTAEQQEKADLAAAQHHFGLLGWAAADLQATPADETASSDDLLGALLKRAAALQEARKRSRVVDWGQPEWRQDGLVELQQAGNAKLQAALDEQKQAAEAAAQQAGSRRAYLQVLAPQRELPQPRDHLLKTVELLADCRPAEVELLEGLGGYRKLIMTWRAVRAQQFVAFTRRDLELRKAKAAALERQIYPDHTKVLSKKEYEAFFDRLMADTARRVQHRDELAEKAKEEALAKLKRSAPSPLNHQRQRPPSPTP